MSITKKILFISHHKDAELGLMKNFFLTYNYEININKPLENHTLPSNLNNFSGVIILGGAMDVDDVEKYLGLKREIEWINKIINTSIPIIGICLGAQLIAKVCGAKVKNHKNNLVEIGYKSISMVNNNYIFKNCPKKVFHWHKQGFSLPDKAIHLASSSTFDVQAFSINEKILGFQFHPEVNENMILNWNSKSAHMLSNSGAVSIDIQLADHAKYSNFVKSWFENILKNWLNIK